MSPEPGSQIGYAAWSWPLIRQWDRLRAEADAAFLAALHRAWAERQRDA